MGKQIPSDVKEFIARYINSVLDMEVLLYLQAVPKRQYSASEIGSTLGIHPQIVRTHLNGLQEKGLLRRFGEDRFQYDPLDPGLRSTINKLAVAYSEQRVAVFSLILTKSNDRIRLFAEAFRIIKGND